MDEYRAEIDELHGDVVILDGGRLPTAAAADEPDGRDPTDAQVAGGALAIGPGQTVLRPRPPSMCASS